jgi:hypothetical protein
MYDSSESTSVVIFVSYNHEFTPFSLLFFNFFIYEVILFLLLTIMLLQKYDVTRWGEKHDCSFC